METVVTTASAIIIAAILAVCVMLYLNQSFLRRRRDYWEAEYRNRYTAYGRAWDKLRASLNEAQRKDLDSSGKFYVKSNKGNLWQINATSYIRNCTMIGDRKGRPAKQPRTYCIHLDGPGQYPLGDHLLAQALLLKTDEDRFRRIALH